MQFESTENRGTTKNVILPQDCSALFRDSESITEIDLSGAHVTLIKEAKGMFNGCSNLENINFGNINTSKVTDMSHMFFGCERLTSLDLSNFNTKNVTDMNHMFGDCKNLNKAKLSENFVLPNEIKKQNWHNCSEDCVRLITDLNWYSCPKQFVLLNEKNILDRYLKYAEKVS